MKNYLLVSHLHWVTLLLQVKSSNHSVTDNDVMDDSLMTAAMDADSDDEQLIGKKKPKSKSTAWIDEEADDDDDDDDEFKG